ncbi:hypothetical protein L6452_45068 [Arctium lappa]|nr:hypothetical protein L6452_45068 [Arctium lappa]
MWRYPSTASFLEGLWPFRPRKFEAITALADRPGKSLKFHRDGDRSLQLLVLNEEFLVSASHQLALTTCARSHSAEGTSAWASRIASPPTTPPQWGCVSFGAETGLPCPWCGWPKKESPLTDARLVVVVKAFVSSRADAREALSNDPNVSSCNDASTATPADGGRRCVPVGCGTARAGPPIDSGRGPVRIGAAAKARAVDMPVEMPSRRSWLAARAVTACLGTCVLPAPACGHPIRPVLKHGPRSLTCDGAAASLSRATESRAPSGPFLSILRDGGSPSDSAFRASFERESVKIPDRDVAADGNVRESGDVGGGLGKSYLFCLTACPPWNRLSRRQGKSAKWIRNLGKRIGSEGWARGSQSRTRRLSADCSSCFRGESGSPRAGRGDGLGTASSGAFPGRRTANSELCSECQSEEIQQARVNGGSNYDSLKRNHSKGTGLAESAGKEDPVELDSSPTL